MGNFDDISYQPQNSGLGDNLYNTASKINNNFDEVDNRIKTNSGSPEGYVTASIGCLCLDITNGVVYKKTSGVGNTGWEALLTSSDLGATIGKISWFAYNSVPLGYLVCDGAAVSRSTYASLYASISTTFGAGNGSTTFNLPDLRGEFVRGFDGGRGVDSGRVFGSAQADEIKAHVHNISMKSSGGDNPLGGDHAISTDNQGDGSSAFTSSYASALSTGGSETRPRNIALLPCIKY